MAAPDQVVQTPDDLVADIEAPAVAEVDPAAVAADIVAALAAAEADPAVDIAVAEADPVAAVVAAVFAQAAEGVEDLDGKNIVAFRLIMSNTSTIRITANSVRC